jgi:hypothetical protein
VLIDKTDADENGTASLQGAVLGITR